MGFNSGFKGLMTYYVHGRLLHISSKLKVLQISNCILSKCLFPRDSLHINNSKTAPN